MGRGSGFHQVKMRNLKTGKQFEHKFRSNDNIDFLRLERKEYQYLYHDGVSFIFMDVNTYEQIPVDEAAIGEQSRFLKENSNLDILFNEDDIISVELPSHVALQVTATETAVRGDTVNNVTKPATLETNAVIQVPSFINEGDVIRVDTRTGEYQERVKK